VTRLTVVWDCCLGAQVETAVRLRHVPTGIVVRCQEERTQLMNRKKALDMLKEKLVAVKEEQRVERLNEIRGDLVEASWGQQIRNYVLHPYKLVKDTRTDVETSNLQDVLDGNLDDFVNAYLRAFKGGGAPGSSDSSGSSRSKGASSTMSPDEE
jgi:peptide chain release factor 2